MVSGIALADGHLDKAIKARKAQMTLYSFNLGVLGAMAKGEAEYNAEAAAGAANNLLAAAKLDGSQMWPQGSDSEAMAGKTRALRFTAPLLSDPRSMKIPLASTFTGRPLFIRVGAKAAAERGGGTRDAKPARNASYMLEYTAPREVSSADSQ